MNNIDRQYKELLEHIIHFGVEKKDRTGTGTKSLFGWQIRHRMEEGFPLLTTKKMAWKSIVTELLWFLRGDTNIKYLVDNGCHIWNGDAYKNYLKWFDEQSKLFKEQGIVRDPWTKEQYVEQIKLGNVDADLSELGPIYGKQWRDWGGYEYKNMARATHDAITYKTYHKKGIDQIANLINELKTNPDSRRLMVNAWNVGELGSMVLPPCHYGFQVYTRELSYSERLRLVNYDKEKFTSIDEWIKWYENEPNEFYYGGINYTKETALTDLGVPTRAISLMYNARSQDVPLGTPFNISSYALLLEIIAKMVNMVPDELISNMGDCHIYLNQIDGVKEQLTRTAFDLPKLVHMKTDDFYKSLSEDLSLLTHLEPSDFQIEGYKSHPVIKMPLSN
jgi:thymidylate synthase